MPKGIAYEEEVVSRCLLAMDEGVPLSQISLVEGVALPTLYTWKVRRMKKRAERTVAACETERLRAEVWELREKLATLRRMVASELP